MSDDFKEFYPLHGKQYEQQMAEQEFTEQDLINNVIAI